MDEPDTLLIAIAPDLAAELRAAVDAGDYDSVSDGVHEALLAWHRRRQADGGAAEELRRLVRQGSESGPGIDADVVFGRLRAKFGQPPVA